MHKAHILFVLLLVVFQGKCQTSSEVDVTDEENVSTITDISTSTDESTEAEPITTTVEALLEDTNDELTSDEENVSESTNTESEPITTTTKALLEDTNDETTPDASSTITINLPTLAPDDSASAASTPAPKQLCKENEVYSCLPFCSRTCHNLLSKIICKPVPRRSCRRGCTCRAGYFLEKTTGKCVKECSSL